VGNACPLTRITTTNEVPSRKPIVLDSESPKLVVKLVYSRKPRKNKNAEFVSKTKVLQPMSANKKEPSKSWGSTNTNIPIFYQIGNVTISRVYYVEGLGHNLFSVGQFCDSNLKVAFRQHTCFIRNLDGSVTTWEDLILVLCSGYVHGEGPQKPPQRYLISNNIQENSLRKALTCFKELTPKFSSGQRSLALNHRIFFYVMSQFHLKYRDWSRAQLGRKILNKNPDKSWEIIENLALYDHEGWNDTKEFVKPVKAISTPQPTSKTPDQRLLELEDQTNFLLKGSRSTPRPSSTHVPQAYAEAVYSNPHLQNQNEPLKQSPFTFCERIGLIPQP
ncbi:hypothetical protein Tco_1549459, partial [Tanacetum coccineum]